MKILISGNDVKDVKKSNVIGVLKETVVGSKEVYHSVLISEMNSFTGDMANVKYDIPEVTYTALIDLGITETEEE